LISFQYFFSDNQTTSSPTIHNNQRDQQT